MKEKITGIYKITSPSGSFYIGSSTDIKSRWSGHRSELRRGKHHCQPLQRAADKYGVDSFTFEVIEVCKREVLREREQAHLNELKPAYNSSQSTFEVLTEKWQDPTFRADGVARAREQAKRLWKDPAFVERQRAAVSKALSESHKDPAFKAQHAARIAEQARRINADPAIVARQTAARNARYEADAELAEARRQCGREKMALLHADKELKARMAEASRERLKALRADPEARARNLAAVRARHCKPVVCVENGVRYASAGDAAKALGVSASSVTKVLRSERASVRGMTFRYVQSNEPYAACSAAVR